jgi:hypothetical protein
MFTTGMLSDTERFPQISVFAVMKRISSQELLADQVKLLRETLQEADPALLAARAGLDFLPSAGPRGELSLHLWGRPALLALPLLIAREAASGEELPTHQQALLLYYLLTCDGTLPSGQWISFWQLPEGRFYDQAFQGYTGSLLARMFGEDLQAFCAACEAVSGRRVFQLGSAAYRFQALPYVPLLVVYWLGDEDFPSSCQVLFDSAVSHHLPTDACAILGSQLTRRLI